MTTDDPASDSDGSQDTGAQTARATSFGAVATAYDAGRPTFPAEAVVWVLGAGRRRVGRRPRPRRWSGCWGRPAACRSSTWAPVPASWPRSPLTWDTT